MIHEFSGSEAFCNFFSGISDIFKCVNNPELFVFDFCILCLLLKQLMQNTVQNESIFQVVDHTRCLTCLPL